ncbi:hypothetical protein RESH_01893 [Rhodopirellula europaea SH398]|uniref:Uncharacterized protein n=1 Tax=Rhodopirellula europaea SH398 TaxID=1263868 RepID=M5S7Q1_9BACT|nr:hypothetical protein RESH_01893 [Rhodopirellula europaea SH398]
MTANLCPSAESVRIQIHDDTNIYKRSWLQREQLRESSRRHDNDAVIFHPCRDGPNRMHFYFATAHLRDCRTRITRVCDGNGLITSNG